MPRPYRLMYSLLYPAVLGTVLLNVFVFLSKVVEGESISGSDFGIGKLVLTFGIVVHFIVDYILGQEAPEHGWRGFWLDCGILGGLWVAAASVHINLSTAPDVQILCGALAWVYLLFLAYLLFVYRGLQHRKLVGVVESIGLVWFVLGALWLSYMTFAAIGLFVSAVLLFWAGNKALHETAVMRSKAAEPAAQPDGYATS